MPSGVVTMTSTLPATAGGAVAVSVVAEVTVKMAGVLPKATAVALVKLVPVTVTEVPPPVGPLDGETPVTVGVSAVAVQVNWSAGDVAEVPSGLLTWTSTVSAAPTGSTTVRVVFETMLNW